MGNSQSAHGYIEYVAYIDPRPLLWYVHRAVASAAGALRSGSSSEYDPEKVTEAIEKLRTTLGYLDDKVQSMCQCTARYATHGRALFRRGNRTGALHQMKLKKMYELEIAKIDQIKFNIESNILRMESMCIMLETVSVTKDTSNYVQLINKNVDLDRLESMIEEISEQRDTSQDIESILSQGTATDVDYDEDELLRELESMSEGDDGIAERAVTATAREARSSTDEKQAPASPPPPPPPIALTTVANEMPLAPTAPVETSSPIIVNASTNDNDTHRTQPTAVA